MNELAKTGDIICFDFFGSSCVSCRPSSCSYCPGTCGMSRCCACCRWRSLAVIMADSMLAVAACLLQLLFQLAVQVQQMACFAVVACSKVVRCA